MGLTAAASRMAEGSGSARDATPVCEELPDTELNPGTRKAEVNMRSPRHAEIDSGQPVRCLGRNVTPPGVGWRLAYMLLLAILVAPSQRPFSSHLIHHRPRMVNASQLRLESDRNQEDAQTRVTSEVHQTAWAMGFYAHGGIKRELAR